MDREGGGREEGKRKRDETSRECVSCCSTAFFANAAIESKLPFQSFFFGPKTTFDISAVLIHCNGIRKVRKLLSFLSALSLPQPLLVVLPHQLPLAPAAHHASPARCSPSVQWPNSSC
jgi:hypothetical protein